MKGSHSSGAPLDCSEKDGPGPSADTNLGTVLPRTYAHAFIKLNLKRMLQAPRTDTHVLLFEYVRLFFKLLTMQLSGVRLIELCYNNCATVPPWTSHTTIATLLSGLSHARKHKDSIK